VEEQAEGELDHLAVLSIEGAEHFDWGKSAFSGDGGAEDGLHGDGDDFEGAVAFVPVDLALVGGDVGVFAGDFVGVVAGVAGEVAEALDGGALCAAVVELLVPGVECGRGRASSRGRSGSRRSWCPV
jgi:hypothetical protein